MKVKQVRSRTPSSPAGGGSASEAGELGRRGRPRSVHAEEQPGQLGDAIASGVVLAYTRVRIQGSVMSAFSAMAR